MKAYYSATTKEEKVEWLVHFAHLWHNKPWDEETRENLISFMRRANLYGPQTSNTYLRRGLPGLIRRARRRLAPNPNLARHVMV